MTCACGHDRDYFHGWQGCTRNGCPCTGFRHPRDEHAPDDLTDLMDAVIA